MTTAVKNPSRNNSKPRKPKTFTVKISAVTLKKDLRTQLVREIAGATKTSFAFKPAIPCLDNHALDDPLFYIDTVFRDNKASPVKVQSSSYNESFDLLQCTTEDLIRIHYRIMKLCQK
jgi:hypothetical protein